MKISPEALEQFRQGLAADDNQQQLSEDQQQAALDEGAAMAQADQNAEGADASQAAPDAPVEPAQPASDPNAEALSSVGFGSVQELVDAFTQKSEEFDAVKETLDKLLAFEKAVGNENDLDPGDPNYEIKSAVRKELEPALAPIRADARNRMVQLAWGKDAKTMPDLESLNAEIGEYLQKNPKLSLDDDGLRRAYDAVRSSKYRPEDDLLADPEFQKRAISNEAIKKAIIEAHLAEVAKNGDLPASISSGGASPLTGKRDSVKTISDASKKALAMLQKE